MFRVKTHLQRDDITSNRYLINISINLGGTTWFNVLDGTFGFEHQFLVYLVDLKMTFY